MFTTGRTPAAPRASQYGTHPQHFASNADPFANPPAHEPYDAFGAARATSDAHGYGGNEYDNYL